MANRLRQTVQSIEATPAEQRMDMGGPAPDLTRGLAGGLQSIAEIVGPQADIAAMVEEARRAEQSFSKGNYLDAAGSMGLAAIAPLMIATPGSVKSVREISENIYKTPVYHSTKKAKEIEDADEIYFVSKNNDADIGFHVATTPLAANQRIILNNIRQEYLATAARKDISEKLKKEQLDQLEKIYEGSSNMLLRLKDNINPARVPDVSNFKNPLNWAETIAISKKDFPDKFKLTKDTAPASYDFDPLIINYKGDELLVSSRYLQDILDNEGKINKEYIEDLVKLVYAAKDKVLSKQDKFNPQSSVQDRRKWFEQLKKVNEKHGYDSFVYKNKYEGLDTRSLRLNPETGKKEIIKNKPERAEDSLMLMYPNQVKYATASEFNPEKAQLSKKQGGSVVERNPYDNYKPKAI